MAKPKSRPTRWAEAVQKCMKAKDAVTVAADELADAMTELYDIQQEYQEWRDNIPENMESSAVAEKLDELLDLSLDNNGCGDDVLNDWASTCDAIESAESAELPLGFGRD